MICAVFSLCACIAAPTFSWTEEGLLNMWSICVHVVAHPLCPYTKIVCVCVWAACVHACLYVV